MPPTLARRRPIRLLMAAAIAAAMSNMEPAGKMEMDQEDATQPDNADDLRAALGLGGAEGTSIGAPDERDLAQLVRETFGDEAVFIDTGGDGVADSLEGFEVGETF